MGTEFSASSNSFKWFYQARVVLYAGGYSSNELIFNAKGSNKHNCFGFNRLKNEERTLVSYPNRIADLIVIAPIPEYGDSFIINSVYSGCPADDELMVAAESKWTTTDRNCLPQEQMSNISEGVCYFARITRVGYEKILGCQCKGSYYVTLKIYVWSF